MKKYFTIVIAVLFFASCNKDLEVDISYQLTANIDIMDVAKYIKDIDGSLIYKNGDLYYDDDYIVLAYMLYDKDGNLVVEERMKLDSFSEITKITKTVKDGDYTIVVCVFMGDDDMEWWNLSGKENLNNLKVRFYSEHKYINSVSGTLGLYKRTISVNKSEDLSINVPPAVSFILLNFQNLSSVGISTIGLSINTWNDFLNVADEKSNILELPNSAYWTLNRSQNSTNRLTYLFYLPTSRYTMAWQGLNAANAVIRGPFNIPSRAIVAGKTYYITIEGNTGQTNISEL